jgi:CRISP-associated protein Cas1
MHHERDGHPARVFDMMEPERPKVDRAVLEFVKRTVFDPTDFTIRGDSILRLNPQMARLAAALRIDG